MKKARCWLALMLFGLAVASCGGGSGASAPPPGGSGNLSASFTADEPNPGTDTVNMDQGSVNGNTVTIDVNITDTSNVFGAGFDMSYPVGMAEFVGHSAGTALAGCGGNVSYIVNDLPAQQRVAVSATCTAPASAQNVLGTDPLIRLTFRATAPGSGAVAFQNTVLQDDSVPPQDLAGIVWAGGTITAN